MNGYTGDTCQTPPDGPCAGVTCQNDGTCSDGVCTCTNDYFGDSCEYYCPSQYLDNGICSICGVDDGDLPDGVEKPPQCDTDYLEPQGDTSYPDGAHLDHSGTLAECSIPGSSDNMNGECWIPPVNVPYWPMGGQYNTDNYYTGLRTYNMYTGVTSGQCFIRGKLISNFMREGNQNNRNEEYSNEEMCKQASQTGVCMVFDGSGGLTLQYGTDINDSSAEECEQGIWSGWEGYQNYGGQLAGALISRGSD